MSNDSLGYRRIDRLREREITLSLHQEGGKKDDARTFNLAIRVAEVDGKVLEPEMREGDHIRDKYIRVFVENRQKGR